MNVNKSDYINASYIVSSACVCVCVRACMRVCMRMCVCVCVCLCMMYVHRDIDSCFSFTVCVVVVVVVVFLGRRRSEPSSLHSNTGTLE